MLKLRDIIEIPLDLFFRESGKAFYYYKLFLLLLIKWIATVMVFTAISGLILIVSDLIFKLKWGYPWWSVLLALLMIATPLAIRYGAANALRKLHGVRPNLRERSKSA